MVTLTYPRTLPCPQTSVITSAERRALDNAERPRDARNVQRDRLDYERITWPPLDAAKAETILVFWRDTLQRGGAWFVADWPIPRGLHIPTVRKFREQPKWQFVPGGFWQLSALCEVRGRGELNNIVGSAVITLDALTLSAASSLAAASVWRMEEAFSGPPIFGGSKEEVANIWRDHALAIGGWPNTTLSYTVITLNTQYLVQLLSSGGGGTLISGTVTKIS